MRSVVPLDGAFVVLAEHGGGETRQKFRRASLSGEILNETRDGLNAGFRL
ncbi:hypothetical protein RRSWK_01946 [Rhodopirellula sp. SWK7]|nr:hypothetical protein RRSWK_01946 [Rhodopirellula sp. SWK7]